MTQSVLNTFKILNIVVNLRAFNLLKYGIRSFSKHDLNLLKYLKLDLLIERINYKKFRSER